MRRFQTFEQFDPESLITRKLIRMLHEGVKVVQLDSMLNEKSNAKSYAQEEIERVVKQARKEGDKALIEDFVPEMLALIDKFGHSGQSGGSAPYTAGAIVGALKKLLMFQPISPVTDEDEDWSDSLGDGTVLQNKRCSALFKQEKNGRPYYIDAIVWRTPKDMTYTGTAFNGKDKVFSRQYVKKFPFEPKTFTIDVDEKEVKPDDWEFYVKDPKQLDEVFDYYDEFKPKEGQRIL